MGWAAGLISTMIALPPVAIVASCAADIAGFVVAGNCNSYLPNGHSQWFAFGVDEFLLVGGGIHIGIFSAFFIMQCLYMWKDIGSDKCSMIMCALYWIYSFLFSVAWNI